MRSDFALGGMTRRVQRPARSIACLAFVAILGAAFWAGATWIVTAVFSLYGQGV